MEDRGSVAFCNGANLRTLPFAEGANLLAYSKSKIIDVGYAL